MDKDYCSCNCYDDFKGIDEYDDIIEQLKETRNSIDRMIRALEHRKMKDNVINEILNTEYEDEDKNFNKDELIEELRRELEKQKYKKTNYTFPYTQYTYYPYYFKF